MSLVPQTSTLRSSPANNILDHRRRHAPNKTWTCDRSSQNTSQEGNDDVYHMCSGIYQGKTGTRKDTAMQCRRVSKRSTTIGSVLGIAIALSLGLCDRALGSCHLV